MARLAVLTGQDFERLLDLDLSVLEEMSRLAERLWHAQARTRL